MVSSSRPLRSKRPARSVFAKTLSALFCIPSLRAQFIYGRARSPRGDEQFQPDGLEQGRQLANANLIAPPALQRGEGCPTHSQRSCQRSLSEMVLTACRLKGHPDFNKIHVSAPYTMHLGIYRAKCIICDAFCAYSSDRSSPRRSLCADQFSE